jgi:hypothetical protein
LLVSASGLAPSHFTSADPSASSRPIFLSSIDTATRSPRASVTAGNDT